MKKPELDGETFEIDRSSFGGPSRTAGRIQRVPFGDRQPTEIAAEISAQLEESRVEAFLVRLLARLALECAARMLAQGLLESAGSRWRLSRNFERQTHEQRNQAGRQFHVDILPLRLVSARCKLGSQKDGGQP